MDQSNTRKILTFVVEIPVYRELTYKKFKRDYASEETEEHARAIWDKLVALADGKDFERKSYQTASTRDEDWSVCVEEVDDLIEETISEAEQQVIEETAAKVEEPKKEESA